jgi:ribonuclease-3
MNSTTTIQSELFRSRLPALQRLQAVIGYTFIDQRLLLEALTHSSAASEAQRRSELQVPFNERLEFLGDAVLGLVIATELMNKPQELAEGDMSRFRAGIVQESVLASVARKIGLGTALVLGRGEELSHGRDKPSVLADSLEALFGAIYQDGGYQPAAAVIVRLMGEQIGGDVCHFLRKDFKSALQEYTQSKYQEMPEYLVLNQSGPAHNPEFDVVVQVRGQVLGRGTGHSKKRASQDAAERALDALMESRHD